LRLILHIFAMAYEHLLQIPLQLMQIAQLLLWY
jgi:hypothetical protein